MEIERLKRIKFYEEQEKIRKEKLITDHHKIVDQIVQNQNKKQQEKDML